MKFATQGTTSSIEVETGSIARTKEVSDDEGADWPGQTHRRRVKAGARSCPRRRAVAETPPGKNKALTDGADIAHQEP